MYGRETVALGGTEMMTARREARQDWLRGEQSQAGSQAGSYGAARKKKRSESQGVRDNQGQPFGERVRDNLLGNPPKGPNLLGKPAFGEATFLGNSSVEEPTFVKVGLEAC